MQIGFEVNWSEVRTLEDLVSILAASGLNLDNASRLDGVRDELVQAVSRSSTPEPYIPRGLTAEQRKRWAP